MRTRVLSFVVAPIVVFAAACSSGSHDAMDMSGAGSNETSVSVPASAAFNAEDVSFAKDMIIHHGQAIEMSDLAVDRAEDPRVLALAASIKAAQDPEIAIMTAWLDEWGFDAPDPMGSMDDSMDAGGNMDMDMAGMMSSAEMGRLDAASGAGFDGMFLEMMVRHHEGAVEMSQRVIDQGEYADVEALANQIIEAQNAEIAEMRAILAGAS